MSTPVRAPTFDRQTMQTSLVALLEERLWRQCPGATPKRTRSVRELGLRSGSVLGTWRRTSFLEPSRLAAREESVDDVSPSRVTFGEDAASFRLSEQQLSSWSLFALLLSSVLAALYVFWIQPSSGYSDEFLSLLTSISDSPEIVMLLLLLIFGVTHSGLAALRSRGESWIGKRAYRVIFALVSLPLAAVTMGYFINHRYQGTQLWMVQDVPGIRPLVWTLSLISFFFLYPSTFNLLEVAAVDEPQLHLWETGVTRITRHPQAFGQALWCFAHTLWIGNSFMVVTSLGLVLHHAFGCWHGDRRLAERHGKAFQEIKARTSTLPFQAILEKRQVLPKDYYEEFLRIPYLTILIFSVARIIQVEVPEMSIFKQVADAKLRDAPNVLRQIFSMEYLRTQFHKTMDAYGKKYIQTNSAMPFWHVVYGGTLFSYICIWPTEYRHFKHKEEARLRGEAH